MLSGVEKLADWVVDEVVARCFDWVKRERKGRR